MPALHSNHHAISSEMLAHGTFRDFDTTTLEELKASYTSCVKALALNQSYSIGDKTLTRIDQPLALDTLREINAELRRRADALSTGVATRTTRVFHPDFSGAENGGGVSESAAVTPAEDGEADEFLLARENHTGEQAISTITGLQSALDELVGSVGFSGAWSDITGKPSTFTPSAHTHPSSDITDLGSSLNLKANLASPTFTGTPSAPTAPPGTNTTQLATTAFVAASVTETVLDVRNYGAVINGTTDDYTAIQAALDACAAAGGGTVYLPPGTYRCSNVLAVGSYTTLVGAGDSSVIKMSGTPAKVIGGVSVNAAIAAVATVGVRIRDLKVDMRTNSVSVNGIQVGEYGASSRSSRTRIERCSVLGFDTHQYLIYGKICDDLGVSDCYSEGLAASIPSSDCAGIEFFGVDSGFIRNCKTKNTNVGIIVKSETGLSGSACTGIAISDNDIRNVISGIILSSTTGGDVIDISLTGNKVYNATTSSARSIKLECVSGVSIRNINIIGNDLRETGRVLLDVYLATGALSEGIAISGNSLYSSTNCDNYANFFQCNGVTFSNNRMAGGGGYYGATFNACTKVSFTKNAIVGSRRRAIHVQSACVDLAIEDNEFIGYDSTNAGDNGVVVDSGTPSTRVRVNRNFFAPTTANLNAAASLLGAQSGSQCLDNSLGFTSSRTQFANDSSTLSRRQVTAAPAGASAFGDRGDWFVASGFEYRCVADNTWQRVAIATF